MGEKQLGENDGSLPPPMLARTSAPSRQSSFARSAFMVVLLVGGMLSASWITGSQDQSERVTTHPSSYSVQTLPSSLLSLLPPPIQKAYSWATYLFDTHPSRTMPFEDWILWEEEQAWRGLLANINHNGTARGCIVASPSTSMPNYWYEWTRDSALTMRTVIHAFLSGKMELRGLIDDYLSATEIIQHKKTLLGGFYDGGLGDVKQEVDHNPFMGEWSRPQPDGPAARVITIVRFAEHLLEHGTYDDQVFVKTKLYDGKTPTRSIIKGDLEYLSLHWRDSGFDLWEEVRGSHFYTLLSIQKALYAGASLADRLADPKAATVYRAEAATIDTIIPEFWSDEKNIIRVSLNQTTGRDSVENAHRGDPTYGKTEELDAAVLLGALHSGEGTEWESSEKVLATLGAFMDTMRTEYPMNAARTTPSLGRYPKDVYDGTGVSVANPWNLCTLAASETLYKASTQLSRMDSPLVVSNISASWYSRFVPVDAGTEISPGSEELQRIITGQRELGDSFMAIVKEYAGRNGSLHEQFDRVTGEGRGARDLTWSYASFITAVEARRGFSRV